MSEQEDIQLPLEFSKLADLVDSRSEIFATGDADIQAAALAAARLLFDLSLKTEDDATKPINSVLSDISNDGPTTRSRTRSGESEPTKHKSTVPMFSKTPLDCLHTEGLTPDQVWAQLELRTKMVCDLVGAILQETADEGGDDDEEVSEVEQETTSMDSDEDEDDSTYIEEDEGSESEVDSAEEGSSQLGEGVTTLRPGEDESSEEELDLDRATNSRDSRHRPMHPTLDDGFFSIDDFNRETEEMEALTRSRGRLAASADDEDDSDYNETVDFFKPLNEETDTFEEDAEEHESNEPFYRDFFDQPRRLPPPRKGKARGNPTASTNEVSRTELRKKNTVVRFSDSVRFKNIKPHRTKSSLLQDLLSNGFDDEEALLLDDDAFGINEDDEDDEDDEGSSDDDDDDDGDEEYGEGYAEAGQIPGTSVLSFPKVNGKKANARTFSEMDDGDSEDGSDDAEMEEDQGQTMQRFKDDLFADEEDDNPDVSLSAHQKRQAELKKQIMELEAENVRTKDWTLMGEATSRSRPVNSLLEEDLDFDRAAKVVPVVTEESTKSLEDRIKARILENRFDDVVRRRPVDDKPFLPSSVFELNDKQSSRSLAQIYEDEYVAAKSGATSASVLDDRDGKLAKEHQEVEKIWGEISYKLDALCNAHFTPKQPKAIISTVKDLPTTLLESALPTATSASTLLAPEEIHAPTKGFAARARSELTPAEKKTLRMREKKARKKRRDMMEKAVDKFARGKGKGKGSAREPKNVKEAKNMALNGLVKSGKGVTVVGKERGSAKERDRKHGSTRGKQVSGTGEGRRLKL